MSSRIFLGLPPSVLFTVPPSSVPPVQPPPPAGSSPSAPLFDIPTHTYRAWLDPKVPLTIAAVYGVTVKLLNRRNTSTGQRSWPVSRTRTFHAFVVVHNTLLAVYSAWTFAGMLGTMRRSMVSPRGPEGLSGFVDSMCRMHGRAGTGNGVSWREGLGGWMHDGDGDGDGTGAVTVAVPAPGQEDRFRIWNEGLAFYGWLFYLSKFYEVLDTLIILAKGKLSSTLQTYHHAGAMMCMWAGMRYMSPPIWLFVFLNSGIHALMYTYYTFTALDVRVPQVFKRVLTSMQITQFIIGASFAMLHSFIYYAMPVHHSNTANLRTAALRQETALTATAAAATLLDTVKAALFGAVARSRPAPLPSSHVSSHGLPSPAADAAVDKSLPGANVHQSYQTVPCITTTGATFAIWLNVLYLAPLTYLFVDFFIRNYLRKVNAVAKEVKGRW